MARTLELLLERDGERLILSSPEVGLFTRALAAGALVAPHAPAGVLHRLGESFELVAPAGAQGRVLAGPPELVLQPVGYGTRLYELAPLDSDAARDPDQGEAEDARGGALLFRAPHSGRFWHRPTPADAPFARTGDVIAEGDTVGLIEVMKTFTHLAYRATGGLPPRARLVRFAVPDGGDVASGAALLELEPA